MFSGRTVNPVDCQNKDRMMKTEARTGAEQLLKEATEVLKAANKNGDRRPDAILNQLSQLSLVLRRELEDTKPRQNCGDATNTRPVKESRSAQLAAEITSEKSIPSLEPLGRRDTLLHRDSAHDFTLARIDRLLVILFCMLAWLVEPNINDSSLALSGLMFVRFVPVFILGGSMCGHALAGAVVGAGLFFGLLGMGAMSFVMWDTYLLTLGATLVRHAAGIANLLYLFAAAGTFLCVAGLFAARRENEQSHKRCVRLATQVCVLVQLALVAELGHIGWRYATHADQRIANVATAKRTHRGIMPH
jgi:hypothetical protein